MMRSWFILFTTTFTITTLIVTLATWLIPVMNKFDIRYVMLLAISSALLSLILNWFEQLPIENSVLNILLDVSVIFTIVFSTGAIIQVYPVRLSSFVIVLILVLIVYMIITLIYLFILTKEAENMNKKITVWRSKHVKS